MYFCIKDINLNFWPRIFSTVLNFIALSCRCHVFCCCCCFLFPSITTEYFEYFLCIFCLRFIIFFLPAWMNRTLISLCTKKKPQEIETMSNFDPFRGRMQQNLYVLSFVCKQALHWQKQQKTSILNVNTFRCGFKVECRQNRNKAQTTNISI